MAKDWDRIAKQITASGWLITVFTQLQREALYLREELMREAWHRWRTHGELAETLVDIMVFCRNNLNELIGSNPTDDIDARLQELRKSLDNVLAVIENEVMDPLMNHVLGSGDGGTQSLAASGYTSVVNEAQTAANRAKDVYNDILRGLE